MRHILPSVDHVLSQMALADTMSLNDWVFFFTNNNNDSDFEGF